MIWFEKEVNFLDQRFEWVVISVADSSDLVQEVNIDNLLALNARDLSHELFDLVIWKWAIVTSSNVFDKEANLYWQEPSIIILICFFQYLHEFIWFALFVYLIVELLIHFLLRINSVKFSTNDVSQELLYWYFININIL